MTEVRKQKEPCGLGLTLLASNQVCPRCGYVAAVHREWVREMKRTGKLEESKKLNGASR